MTKTPQQLWDELGVGDDEELTRAAPDTGPDAVQSVNCKSCGHVLDVSGDPENWPLQCGQCVADGVPLPPGYGE